MPRRAFWAAPASRHVVCSPAYSAIFGIKMVKWLSKPYQNVPAPPVTISLRLPGAIHQLIVVEASKLEHTRLNCASRFAYIRRPAARNTIQKHRQLAIFDGKDSLTNSTPNIFASSSSLATPKRPPSQSSCTAKKATILDSTYIDRASLDGCRRWWTFATARLGITREVEDAFLAGSMFAGKSPARTRLTPT